MARHHEYWYIKRLQKHYNENYIQHDDEVEWFANAKPNEWRFRIPSMKLEITLICEDDESITAIGRTYKE